MINYNSSLVKLTKIIFGIIALFLLQNCNGKDESTTKNESSDNDVETEVRKEIETVYIYYTESDLKWVDYYNDQYTFINGDGTVQTEYADSLRMKWKNIYMKNDVILQDYGKPTIFASGNKALHYNTAREIIVDKTTKDTSKFDGTWIAMWGKQADNSWKIIFETYQAK
jgi:hypothetical protein